MSENCYSECFLALLSQTLLFHWCTPKYAHHMALDKLLARLQDHIDKFVEVYLAKFNKQPVKPFNIKMTANSDCSKIIPYYEHQLEHLKKIKTSLKTSTELQGIIEGMCADIIQCIYILNLDKD
jgi:hypothetical protein